MLDFRFAHPIAFALLIPAAFVLYRWLRGTWRSAPPVMRYSDTRLLSGLTVGLRVRLRRLPDALRLLAWVLLVIALARPQMGASRELIEGEGIDMALALDISGSMIAPDFPPMTRLEAAKSVIQDFISGREFDRIGLVVFAEQAYYQAPPTLDYALLLQALERVTLAPQLGLGNQTAIGMGLASAANMLRSSTAESRIIILLTDGANNAGTVDPIAAAEAARTFGIRIYTIGMGTPGAIPITTTDGETRTLISDLDEPMLRNIAQIGGGRYFNALDLTDLRDIYAEIDQLERTTLERQVVVRWNDQAGGWLLAALLLLLIERLLRHTIFQTLP